MYRYYHLQRNKAMIMISVSDPFVLVDFSQHSSDTFDARDEKLVDEGKK